MPSSIIQRDCLTAAPAAYAALAAHLAADGLTITSNPPRNTERGRYNRATGTVNVCPDPAPDIPDMLTIPVHEAAHYVTTGTGDDYTP